MSSSVLLKQRLLKIHADSFESLALDVFRFQYEYNKIYRKYVDLLKINIGSIKKIQEIPFLPIQFFKSHKISTTDLPEYKIYESSGTTGSITSKHFVYDEDFYFEVAKRIFEDKYGALSQYNILALLPNYLERSNSSLVAMVNHFMKFSGPDSGFYLDDFSRLHDKVNDLKHKKEKFILWGVTFALMDFSEVFPVSLGDNIVLETGGMKGRKKEMVRGEVHEMLCQNFKVRSVHAEYGMTELFSQAYSHGDGFYSEPFSMKVLLRELNDPFNYVAVGKRGGVNVIDLANVDSCSFIATQDLGVKHNDDTFEILGRFDDSDVRGCNLMAG